jgi:hypothetical protein
LTACKVVDCFTPFPALQYPYDTLTSELVHWYTHASLFDVDAEQKKHNMVADVHVVVVAVLFAYIVMLAPPARVVVIAAGVVVTVVATPPPHKMTGNRGAGVPGCDTLIGKGADLMRLTQIEWAHMPQFLSPH